MIWDLDEGLLLCDQKGAPFRDSIRGLGFRFSGLREPTSTVEGP